MTNLQKLNSFVFIPQGTMVTDYYTLSINRKTEPSKYDHYYYWVSDGGCGGNMTALRPDSWKGSWQNKPTYKTRITKAMAADTDGKGRYELEMSISDLTVYPDDEGKRSGLTRWNISFNFRSRFRAGGFGSFMSMYFPVETPLMDILKAIDATCKAAISQKNLKSPASWSDQLCSAWEREIRQAGYGDPNKEEEEDRDDPLMNILRGGGYVGV